MYILSDHQIDYIYEDILARGIESESLRQSLLDHVCSLVENELTDDEGFEACYDAIIKRFYRDELREIEEAAQFLATHRRFITLGRNRFLGLLFILFIAPFPGRVIGWCFFHAAGTGWNIPTEIWGGSLVFSLFPLGIWLVLLLTPEKYDPLIPRGSSVCIGFGPVIKILT